MATSIIVLASDSRLQLLLCFAQNTPTRAAVLESQSLLHLPIMVDYSKGIGSGGSGAQARFISAVRYPDRVRNIAIKVSPKKFDQIYKVLDSPFPALVSLEIFNNQDAAVILLVVRSLQLASTFIISVKSLRHLRLPAVQLSSLR